MNSDNLSRNICFYEENELVLKSENKIIENFLDQDKNLLKIFSNAFFIECSKKSFEDNEIKFVSFSNMRKDEYKIKTIIKGNYVYKTAISQKSKSHIEKVKNNIDIMNKIGIKTVDEYSENGIFSKFQTSDTLDKLIIKKFSQGDGAEAKKLIKNFYYMLKAKLPESMNSSNVFDTYNIDYEQNDIENLNFTEYGFWDLIFQNVFYIDSEFISYDQEWIENDMPIEYIMYRAITYNLKLQRYITLEEFFSITNINSNNIKLFTQLDEKLQLKTRNELAWNVHISGKTVSEKTLEKESKISTLENEKKVMTDEFNVLLNQKDARIKFLEDNIQNDCKIIKDYEFKIKLLEEKINGIENSKLWKITKPLRKMDEIIKRRNSNEN
jgi:hypothetical protein